jgi:peptidoglycan/LPS O-acetylase OafA/YrhL
MSVTTQSLTTPTSTATRRRISPLARATVGTGIIAAAAVTAVAAIAHAAGISFAVDGEMIPLAGFAQMTFLGAVIGGVLLAVLNRRSSAPGRRFLQITVALTALSCVPSVALPDDVATKITLVALHALAAAMIVPVVVRHAHD